MSNPQVIHLKNQPGWQNSAMFYQIYPLGFCGAPFENDGRPEPRIRKVIDWVEHLKGLHTGAVYFSPVFESDTHGYDTRDFRKIDARLGSNQDFADVCNALHEAGVRVVLDGVFNHVGRGFWAFQDVLKNREASPYKDWFHINFGGNSNYNDGLWYEGWEGHFELVKLNLQNPAVVDHLLECVSGWMEEFAIDGLRLDVAYLLDENFLRRLRQFTKGRDPAFFLLGEMIHGDYRRIMNPEMLDSVTNYECYKGLYSSFNDKNMFEIAHSLNRQFGSESWCLYRGEHLLCFADNHDVTRIHTMLKEKEQLPGLYAMLYCMPGIPCLYYGSEWGADGDKKNGDPSLRPCFEKPVENELTRFIGRLSQIKLRSKALSQGDYKNETLLNKQIVIRRECPEETVFAAINADQSGFNINVNYHGPAVDLFTGEARELNGCIELPPYGVRIYRLGPGGTPPAPAGEPEIAAASAPEAPAQPEPQPAPAPAPQSAAPEKGPEKVAYGAVSSASREQANAFLRVHWQTTERISQGLAVNLAGLPALGAWQGSRLVGLAVYMLTPRACKILSLNSDIPGQGIGTELLNRVKALAKEQGCRYLTAVTTNDNLEAMGFYQRRGFDMARLCRYSVEFARQLGQEIPEMGLNRIPRRDEIEFEMYLD